MPVTIKVLIPTKTASSLTNALEYSTNLGVAATIDKFTARNLGTAQATITVSVGHLTPNPGDDLIVVRRTMSSSEVYDFPELVGQTLNGGGAIYVIATSDGITIRASGREIN